MAERTDALIREPERTHRRDQFPKPLTAGRPFFDEDATALTPAHAKRTGKRYRYYVGGTVNTKQVRIPSGEIEGLVRTRLASFFGGRDELMLALLPLGLEAEALRDLQQRACGTTSTLETGTNSKVRQILIALDLRVELSDTMVKLNIDRAGLAKYLDPGQRICLCGDPVHVLEVEARIQRTGHGARLQVQGRGGTPNADLVRLIIKSRALLKLLEESDQTSLTAVAKEAGHSGSWFTRMIRLNFLAPDIIKSILEGTQPQELTPRKLMSDTRLALNWKDQCKDLGFES